MSPLRESTSALYSCYHIQFHVVETELLSNEFTFNPAHIYADKQCSFMMMLYY